MKLYHSQERNATPICPVCGMEAAFFFRMQDSGEIIGCSECAESVDSAQLELEREESGYWDEVDREVDRLLEFMEMRKETKS